MAQGTMDLKLASDGREYRGVPLEKLVQWIGQRRVSAKDWVRISGSDRWQQVSQVPELARHLAGNRKVEVARPAVEVDIPQPAHEAAAAPAGHADEDLGITTPTHPQRRRKRRILEYSSMEMTPMIDVTFQLLIFFMFTNQLANPNPIEVPEAVYGRGVLPDGTQAVLVDDQGRYYAGESTKEENIADSLDALIQEVSGNAALSDGPMDVIISAHKNARHLHVRQLVERLEKLDNIGQVRLGVEERQK